MDAADAPDFIRAGPAAYGYDADGGAWRVVCIGTGRHTGSTKCIEMPLRLASGPRPPAGAQPVHHHHRHPPWGYSNGDVHYQQGNGAGAVWLCLEIWDFTSEFLLQMAMLIGTSMVDHFLFESTIVYPICRQTNGTDQGKWSLAETSSRFSRWKLLGHFYVDVRLRICGKVVSMLMDISTPARSIRTINN